MISADTFAAHTRLCIARQHSTLTQFTIWMPDSLYSFESVLHSSYCITSHLLGLQPWPWWHAGWIGFNVQSSSVVNPLFLVSAPLWLWAWMAQLLPPCQHCQVHFFFPGHTPVGSLLNCGDRWADLLYWSEFSVCVMCWIFWLDKTP